MQASHTLHATAEFAPFRVTLNTRVEGAAVRVQLASVVHLELVARLALLLTGLWRELLADCRESVSGAHRVSTGEKKSREKSVSRWRGCGGEKTSVLRSHSSVAHPWANSCPRTPATMMEKATQSAEPLKSDPQQWRNY